MKHEDLKYYNLNKKFTKVLTEERLPERDNSETLVKKPSIYSRSVFVITDNGPALAYYDYEDAKWRSVDRDNFTEVIYWLEEEK